MTGSGVVNLVLLGNTGSGKSYICKALGCDFLAGRSPDGHGVTRQVQTGLVELDGVNYKVIDTPGLVENDSIRMQENADEIVRVLQTGGAFKILVVVRDESGRDDSRVSYFAKKIHDAVPRNVKMALVVNKVAVSDIDRVTDETMAEICERYNRYGNVFDPRYVMKIKEANLSPGRDDHTSQNARDSFRIIKLDLTELLQKMDPVDINPKAVRTITTGAEGFNRETRMTRFVRRAKKPALRAALGLTMAVLYALAGEQIERM
ncbi:hypothetical protein EC973_006807 [Apophysomyces ossiformis]|uniref:G domain-containing protein n=1 Tax=Apophysomyces ossiformis TaxID=679940 RepID=A0A8H7BIU1_9FUNG|nr:hypothetical protein EC973_006807 [Apophysomyces ossiformis]